MERRFQEMKKYIGKGAMVYTYYNTEKINHKLYDEDTIVKTSKFSIN